MNFDAIRVKGPTLSAEARASIQWWMDWEDNSRRAMESNNMTTTLKLHVNGRYKAIVKQDSKDPVEVHGFYAGSPNPTGEASFTLQHKTSNKFVISEEEVPVEEPTDTSNLTADFDDGPSKAAIERKDATAPGAVLTAGVKHK